MHLKLSFVKWWPSCLSLNVLTDCLFVQFWGSILCFQAAGPAAKATQADVDRLTAQVTEQVRD